MIRRRYTKRDANHREIVEALEACGFTVIDLAALGDGAPDILAIGPRGFCLMEIKAPDARPSRKAAEMIRQKAFRERYRGPRGTLVEVRSRGEALRAMGVQFTARNL